MGCGIEKQKKQYAIKDMETCSKKNLEQNINNDLPSGKQKKQMNETKPRTETLVISTNSMCCEIIHSNDKAKLRITNYYIDLDGRILAKQKEIKDEKLSFQFSLETNNIIMRRKVLTN